MFYYARWTHREIANVNWKASTVRIQNERQNKRNNCFWSFCSPNNYEISLKSIVAQIHWNDVMIVMGRMTCTRMSWVILAFLGLWMDFGCCVTWCVSQTPVCNPFSNNRRECMLAIENIALLSKWKKINIYISRLAATNTSIQSIKWYLSAIKSILPFRANIV